MKKHLTAEFPGLSRFAETRHIAYRGVRAPIAFAAVMSNFKLDERGMFDAEITIALENENTGVAEIGHRLIRESPEEWRKKVSVTLADSVRSLRPGCSGPVQYLAALHDRADLGLGTLKLRFTVTDRLTGYTDSKALSTTLLPL